jgi:hypothetical protein
VIYCSLRRFEDKFEEIDGELRTEKARKTHCLATVAVVRQENVF